MLENSYSQSLQLIQNLLWLKSIKTLFKLLSKPSIVRLRVDEM